MKKKHVPKSFGQGICRTHTFLHVDDKFQPHTFAEEYDLDMARVD